MIGANKYMWYFESRIWKTLFVIVISISMAPVKAWNTNHPNYRIPFPSLNDLFQNKKTFLFSNQIRKLPLSNRINKQKWEMTMNTNEFHFNGVYRCFAEHAFQTLQSKGIIASSDLSSPDDTITSNELVPSDLAQNEAPAKGAKNLNVRIEVKAREGSSPSSVLRLARYAFLETQKISTSSSLRKPVSDGIHVLNLVLFPKINYANVPIFSADLVTLPGNKHLLLIDFQPILVQESDANDDDTTNNKDIAEKTTGWLRLPNEQLYNRLKNLHQIHVLDNQSSSTGRMPWGGDFPPKAKRFFSPFVLWTRLKGENVVKSESNHYEDQDDPLNIIHGKVFNAFVDYLDLYIDVLEAASENMEIPSEEIDANTINKKDNMNAIDLDKIKEGHDSYLNYRRDNDPARPMLTRYVFFWMFCMLHRMTKLTFSFSLFTLFDFIDCNNFESHNFAFD